MSYYLFARVKCELLENKDFFGVIIRIRENLTKLDILTSVEPESNECNDLKENLIKPHIL